MYVYKVSNAGVSLAFVIEVSIAACLDLTKSLCVVIALGIAVDFSAFLVMYQSVLANSSAACTLTVLINFVLRPSITTTGSKSTPSSSVAFASACAFAVAVPYDPVALVPSNE